MSRVGGDRLEWMTVRGRSKITECKIEIDIATIDGATVHSGDANEADVERVLVRADFRHAGEIDRHGEPQQLRDLRRGQHELEDAVIRRMRAGFSVFPQEPQD